MDVEDQETPVKHFLGFDFSTQQAKAVVIDENQKILQEVVVQYDSELPEFRTHGGVIASDDGVTVSAPTMMWVKALDMILDKLRVAGADFTKIVAISGAAQQHGSVYWRSGAEKCLATLQPSKFLHEQLSSCFSLTHSPVWMDSSTITNCRTLEQKLGGSMKVAELTGSKAFPRYTGNQIAKIYDLKKDVYHNTERISLVSSFVCSLLTCSIVPIDYADGSGMNLLDINTKEWNQQCLDACAQGLRERLGNPVNSSTCVGCIGEYFVERYEFDVGCKVISFTGDNCASFAGMCISEGDIVLSLGTSDTLFLALTTHITSLLASVSISCCQEDQFMSLLCYSNGSLVRERIRDQSCEGSWEIFDQLLEVTPMGNFGNIGMYYPYRESINPGLSGIHRWSKDGTEMKSFSAEVEVRALIEGQFMAKKAHAQAVGVDSKNIKRVLATGGASCNRQILQVLADVINANVYTMDLSNSACLGSAFRAKHGYYVPKTYTDVITPPAFSLAAKPHPKANEVYKTMLERFIQLETMLLHKTEI